MQLTCLILTRADPFRAQGLGQGASPQAMAPLRPIWRALALLALALCASLLVPLRARAQTLKPLGTEPEPDSTAYFGPTQGGEVLFKLNNSVYSNRPLTLQIFAPGQSRPSLVSLDL